MHLVSWSADSLCCFALGREMNVKKQTPERQFRLSFIYSIDDRLVIEMNNQASVYLVLAPAVCCSHLTLDVHEGPVDQHN